VHDSRGSARRLLAALALLVAASAAIAMPPADGAPLTGTITTIAGTLADGFGGFSGTVARPPPH
jgi:hypothetical protein